MATMTITTEVEATPELVIKSLRNFAAPTEKMRFPFPAKTLLMLKPEYLAALGAIEEMPVLVLMTGVGTALGMVAMQLPNGQVTAGFISKDQVVGVYKPE